MKKVILMVSLMFMLSNGEAQTCWLEWCGSCRHQHAFQCECSDIGQCGDAGCDLWSDCPGSAGCFNNFGGCLYNTCHPCPPPPIPPASGICPAICRICGTITASVGGALQGTVVALRDKSGKTNQTRATDENGYYEFNVITAGRYYVEPINERGQTVTPGYAKVDVAAQAGLCP